MRVSRAFFGCLVVASCQSYVCARDTVSDAELILGPVVPMGILERPMLSAVVLHAAPKMVRVIPPEGIATTVPRRLAAMPRLQGASHDLTLVPIDAGSAPVPQVSTASSNVIRRPSAAPMMRMVQPTRPVSSAQAVHPDVVQQHLADAFQSLRSAGLVDEAIQVHAIQQRFLQNHYQTLLIAHKESQVQMLQAEIARLKQSQLAALSDVQVNLQLQIVHVNHDQREELVKALREISSFYAPSNPPKPVHNFMIEGLHNVRTQAVKDIVKGLVEKQCAKIVAEPSASVLNGRTVHFACENESSTSTFVVVSPQDRFVPPNSGSTFRLCPDVVPSGEIRLSLHADILRQLPASSTRDEQPLGLRKRFAVGGTTELQSGRTLVFVGPSACLAENNSTTEYSTCHLVLVTPTVIQNPVEVPAAPPSAFSVEYQSARPVIEAKAIK